MDGSGINGLFQGILQNPQMMSSLLGILSELGNDGSGEGNPDPQEEKAEAAGAFSNNRTAAAYHRESDNQAPPKAANPSGNQSAAAPRISNSRRKNLLIALKPFMCPERCEKIDTIINILSIAEVAQSLGISNLKL